MGAKQRLKEFFKSERGNVLAMGAAAMPMLLASAGFAVDTIQLAVMKRQMQRAADSSAIAGAYAMAQGTTTTEEQSLASAAATRDIEKNKTPALVGTPTIVTGASSGFQRTVRVELAASPRLPFMAIFTKAPVNVSATATAALVENGTFCLLSLYNGTGAGIDVGGNADLDLGCGMATNAEGSNGVRAGGSSTVNASPIMSRGGLSGSSNYADGTRLQPYSAEQKDPFASLPNPPAQSGCSAKSIDPKDDEDLSPGCYSSLEIKGTARLAAGTYYINGGDLEFGSQAKVSGSGVTFVLTGPGGAAGDLKMNAQAELTLSAPTAGTYKNILFYRDRRAANIDIKINGGSKATLTGALYFPSSDVTFNGNSGFTAECFQLVGHILTFRGTASITNTCPGGAADPTFRLQFVRLVK
jgi:Flp pilus assembly protein TadG